MRILLEVLERDRFEIYDPAIPYAAETAKIVHEAGLHDTVRILLFDPQTLNVSDVTARFYDDYQGSYDEDAPLWIQNRPGFEGLAAEERQERREMEAHYRSFRYA